MQQPELSSATSSVGEFLRPFRRELDPFVVTVERAPVGIAHFDHSGRFQFVNPRLCSLVGLTRDELLTKTFQDISFSEDLPRCLALNEQLATGRIPGYSVEKRFTRPDGSLVRTRVIVSKVMGKTDDRTFFLGIVEDLSDQLAAEESRSLAEERLKLALDASAMGIYHYDFQTESLVWSNGLAKLLGLADDDRSYSLQQLFTVIHPEDYARCLVAYERCAQIGSDVDEEFRIVLPDGRVRWIADRARVTVGAAGRPRYLTGACLDITKRREAEAARALLLDRERAARAEAERAIALRDEVLAIVAHDLRSPLHAVLSGVDLVQSAARDMDSLIGDLLDATQIELGRLAITPVATSVTRLIDSAVAAAAKQAHDFGLRIETDVPPHLPEVSADRQRIVQVLGNLVHNALKFTPGPGRITIRAREDGGFVDLSVQDTGQGISPADLPRVFERYWQGKLNARRGVGLGLTIVRGLVEAHGGKVGIESRLGEGTTVHFTLPIHAVSA